MNAVQRDIDAVDDRTVSPFPFFTDQQYRVLKLTALGLSAEKIGDHLHIARTTVGGHVCNIFAKVAETFGPMPDGLTGKMTRCTYILGWCEAMRWSEDGWGVFYG